MKIVDMIDKDTYIIISARKNLHSSDFLSKDIIRIHDIMLNPETNGMELSFVIRDKNLISTSALFIEYPELDLFYKIWNRVDMKWHKDLKNYLIGNKLLANTITRNHYYSIEVEIWAMSLVLGQND